MLGRYEYLVFILMLQALPYFALRDGAGRTAGVPAWIWALQVAMICIFFLAWGGYSVDAWRYAWGFDKNPVTFKREWFFWGFGWLLSRALHDPWPMKIISALSAGLAAGGVVWYLKRHGPLHVVVGLFVLACLPLFIFGFGNAVRQGMAASIMMAAVIFFVRGSPRLFGVLSVLGLLVHVSALILVVAAWLSKRPLIRPSHILVAAPVLGIVVPRGLALIGVDVSGWIPYSEADEGSFHYAKFAAAYLVAWIILAVRVDCREDTGDLGLIYIYAASFSFLLLNYEVPFERLLLLSQIVLPLMFPFYALEYAPGARAMRRGWALMYSSCALVWLHGSVPKTLGFA